jgi:hypothetical protein
MDTDNDPVKPTREIWSRLGGQLGVGLCALGFLLVFLGWNGAASVDRIPSQFPYLISGGVAGLCFVVLGVGMIVVQNQRADRAALQTTLRELQASLERAGLAQSDGTDRKPFARPRPRPYIADDTAEVALPREAPLSADGPPPTGRGATTQPRKAAPRKAPSKSTS